uniref:Uncharacterized protein n=1 Tax=Timema douglasi TaxID=61478 RepID=A0A7R8ZFM9_TIMDO|nr:unnamed protein product [Timema douglasi]
MIEYNLNYVQERTPEGSYVYTLDPNIEYLCCYPGMKSTRVLSYGGKQLVAHELELEKLRRAWEKLDITNNAPDSMDTGESEQRASLEPIRTSRSTEGPRKDVMINKITNTQLLPNHLQTLVPKVVTPDKVPECTLNVIFDDSLSEYRRFTGGDCTDQFVEVLVDTAKCALDYYSSIVPMPPNTRSKRCS